MRTVMGATRAFAILLLSCLALNSCGIFFLSPFSSDLAQTLAVRDFSKEIDDPTLDEFRPFVLEKITGSVTTRLILLVGGQLPGGQPYPVDKPWLFVLKEDLSLAQAPYTRDELGLIIGTTVSGTYAMVDSNGQVLVGNALFDIVGATIAPVGRAGSLGGLYSWGFPMHASGDNVANMRSSGLNLDWDRYDHVWLSPAPGSKSIRASTRYLWLREVFADPNPAATTVILAFEENKDTTTDTSTTYFVRVPRQEFDGSLRDNFLDDGLHYPSTPKTDLDGSHMGYTDDGIVAYEYKSQSWIMFPFDAPNVVQSMGVGNISDDLDNQRVAWSYSGGYACVYDKRSRTLSKVAKWWK
jgi:hypothetical protein